MAVQIGSIAVALENELRERDFYIAQSQRTTNPLGKAMFARIAADEDEHYLRLLAIHERLAGQGRWPETIASIIGSSDIRSAFRKLASNTGEIAPSSRDDIEALKIAIAFEATGYSFYARLKNEAETEQEKNFFELIASMEREHMLSLQDALLYFEHPDDWFAGHEKPQLEG